MTEQEITYTVEKKKSETVTVCDGCGVEVEPGENCRTLLSGDVADYDYDSDFYPGYVHLEKDSYKLKNDEVFVRVEGFLETFEDPFHYCFDCWDGVNLSVDEKSFSMSESYSDKVRVEVRDELREELKEQSTIKKLRYASGEDLAIALIMLVCTAASVLLVLDDILMAPVAAVTALLTFGAVNDLLHVRL